MTELNETIPIENLLLLSKMTIKDYTNFAKYKPNEMIEHFSSIMDYVKDHIKCKGSMKKIYKYSESSKNGRLNGIHSIQNLDGIIRGFLFGGTTTDFDMKNAHPHILEYICRSRNIRCPNLTEYVNNRDSIITKLKKNGIADPKFEILKMLNTEKMVRITNDCDNILKNLRDDFKSIRATFKKEEDFIEQLTNIIFFRKYSR